MSYVKVRDNAMPRAFSINNKNIQIHFTIIFELASISIFPGVCHVFHGFPVRHVCDVSSGGGHTSGISDFRLPEPLGGAQLVDVSYCSLSPGGAGSHDLVG